MKRQEELNEAWCKYMGKCSTEILHALAFALRWCDEHPHWISVEEELPKKGDAILAMQDIQGNHWFTACQFIKADVCRGIVDFFVKSDAHIGISVDGKVTLGHVSHWMSLPQAPDLPNSVNTGKDLKGGEK